MIMVSDITMNNYTEPSAPTWLCAENYSELLCNEQHIGVLARIVEKLKH